MLRSAILVLGVCGAAALPRRGAAFVSSRSAAMRPAQRRTAMPRTLQMSAAALPMPDAAQPAACGMSFSVKGKTVTPMGIWVGLMSFFWATAMCVAGVALFLRSRVHAARDRAPFAVTRCCFSRPGSRWCLTRRADARPISWCVRVLEARRRSLRA